MMSSLHTHRCLVTPRKMELVLRTSCLPAPVPPRRADEPRRPERRESLAGVCMAEETRRFRDTERINSAAFRLRTRAPPLLDCQTVTSDMQRKQMRCAADEDPLWNAFDSWNTRSHQCH